MIQLLHGDCLELMKQIPDKSVDMILQDPPYNTTACKWEWDIMTKIDEFWAEWKRIIKPNGAIVMTASQPFTSYLVVSNVKMFKHEWIWIKNRGSNFANTVREPMKEHESCLMFSQGNWTYNKQMQERTGGGIALIGKNVGTGKKQREGVGRFREFKNIESLPKLRVPSSWQKHNVEVGLHPTQKPASLMEYLIKTYTNEGDTVFDGFVGSGTTGVACKNLNRRFIGIELDETYFKIAEERIKAA